MLHCIGHTQSSQIMANQNDLRIKIYISHSHTFNPSQVSLQADCKKPMIWSWTSSWVYESWTLWFPNIEIGTRWQICGLMKLKIWTIHIIVFPLWLIFQRYKIAVSSNVCPLRWLLRLKALTYKYVRKHDSVNLRKMKQSETDICPATFLWVLSARARAHTHTHTHKTKPKKKKKKRGLGRDDRSFGDGGRWRRDDLLLTDSTLSLSGRLLRSSIRGSL